MLRHIVLFQKLPDADDALVSATLERLRSLGRIPGVSGLRTGIDVSRRSGFDAALTCDFATLDDLRTYLEDPAHRTVAEHVLPRVFRRDWQVVDFEMDVRREAAE